MVEDVVEQRYQVIAVGRDQVREGSLLREANENLPDAPRVGEAGGEVQPAVHVPHDQAPVAAVQQRRHQPRVGHGLLGNAVLGEEARQVTIGVQDVAVLVGPVEAAGAERREQRQRVVAGQEPGRERRDLSLEHLVERCHARDAVFEREQVVAVEHGVLAPVGAERVIEPRLGPRQKAVEDRPVDLAGVVRGAVAVEALAVRADCATERVHDGASTTVVERAVEGALVRRERLVDLGKEGRDVAGDFDRRSDPTEELAQAGETGRRCRRRQSGRGRGSMRRCQTELVVRTVDCETRTSACAVPACRRRSRSNPPDSCRSAGRRG
ncbi:MAG: hypothetical protein U5K81_00840 [Trueperaceae bacterium]|nr:hypothetical protein [Trueperaceae bacterium]